MPVVNRLKPKENIFIECIDFLTDMKESMIVDRFHLSEEAYGPIKRGGSRFDFRQLKIIELSLLAMNAVCIYCSNEKDFIEKKFEEDDETFTKKDEISRLLDLFQVSIFKSSLNWHSYVIGMDMDEIASRIEKLQRQDDPGEAFLFQRYRTIGNLREAEVLIVGEKYGDKLLPPLVPFGNNMPGLKLFQSLEETKIGWNKIALTNAFKHDVGKEENQEALLKEMKLPNISKVICLGENSYNYVKSVYFLNKDSLKKEIKISKVYHPSAAFVYKKMSTKEYANMISKEFYVS